MIQWPEGHCSLRRCSSKVVKVGDYRNRFPVVLTNRGWWVSEGQDGEGGPVQGDDGDVVLLAELFGCGGDGGGALAADGQGAVKAVEFAVLGAGFDDAIGDRSEE